MDKVEKLSRVAEKILDRYLKIYQKSGGGIDTKLIVDRTGRHLQLLRFGWLNEYEFAHYPAIDFDIRGDKLWILENRTDFDLASDLRQMGIRDEDVVLGFIPEEERVFTEYAVK